MRESFRVGSVRFSVKVSIEIRIRSTCNVKNERFKLVCEIIGGTSCLTSDTYLDGDKPSVLEEIKLDSIICLWLTLTR